MARKRQWIKGWGVREGGDGGGKLEMVVVQN